MKYSVETLPRMDADIKKKAGLYTNNTFRGENDFKIPPTVNGVPIGSDNLNGTNYLMVYGVGTPEENARELQAAYNEAKKMPRYLGNVDLFTSVPDGNTYYVGQTLYEVNEGRYVIVTSQGGSNSQTSYTYTTEEVAKSTRTTVIVAPGEYNFGDTAFVVNTPYINIVSLTGNSDVIIRSTEYEPRFGKNCGIKVTVGNILLKGIDCKTNTFYIANDLDNLICEYCIGGDYSFGGGFTFSSKSINCIGGASSFGGDGGIFSDIAIAIDCIGGNSSFGGGDSGTFSGTSINCTGGDESFGGGADGFLIGTLENCKLTSGTFSTPTGAGKIYNSIDGNGVLVNYPAIESGVNYKVYTGIFTQSGDTAPTVNVLENTIGNIIWSRIDMGMFKGTLNNSFQLNKTYSPQHNIHIQNGLIGEVLMTIFRENDNEIFIYTAINDDEFVDEAIEQQFIEIRVYN